MPRPPFVFVVWAVLVVVSLDPVAATVSSTRRSSAAAYNLVRNAGFESSSTELLCWQGTAAPDDDAHTGVVSAKLGGEQANKATTTLIQTFSFQAETAQRCYTIQFWAKHSAAYNPNQNALNASLVYHDVVTLLTNNTGSATQLPVMNGGLRLTANADDARGWELFSFFQCLASVPSKNGQDKLRLEIRGNGYLIDDVSVSLQRCPDDGQFEEFLRGLLKEYNVPSLAVAAVKNGVTICAMAVGTRIAQKSLPVTVTDRYHIGSDGKAMTAILAGITVEQGKLKWDTKVTEVFPELVPLMTEEFKRINLTQLLSHSSGIGQAGDIAVFTDLVPELDCGDTERNLEAMRYEVLRFLAPRSLATPPGTQWSYSNVGYMIAGAMVERALGQPYERLITTRVFDGLHLLTAGLGCQVGLGRIDAAIAHKKYPNGTLEPFLAGPHCDNPAVLAPAGIAHMSLLDFANWAGWSAGQGKRGPHIVTPATIVKTHTGVIEANPPNPPPGTPPPGMYAMGWGLRAIEWAPAPLLYHAGSNNKNLVNAWLDPKEDFAMVTMTNTADPQSEDALIKVAEKLYTKLVAGGKA